MMPMDEPCAADFEEIRRRTEARWSGGAGRFPPGTRWNPGLSPDEIDAYERALGVRFPASFRCLLGAMNGTDQPGVYAYPRDLAAVRQMMSYVAADREGIAEVLADQEFRLEPDAALVPIYSHRYLVCREDAVDGPVLSIVGTDAIVYGGSLVEYLQAELYSADQLREAGWRVIGADPA
jgi:hypothetical protein